MLHRRILLKDNKQGFTLVELIVVIMLVGITTITFYVIFNNTLSQYLGLQKDASDFSDISYQSQRLAGVLRGTTDIVSETADDITCYAYFAPNDTYVSLIHYYKNASKTQLLADVTPMTANPPSPAATPLTNKLQTYKIINNFYQSPTLSTFVYLNDSGSPMTLPINDEHTIKGIRVNLAVKGNRNSDQSVVIQVSLRNRKNNL